MTYKVELSRRAQRDIVAAHDHIWRDAPGRANRWRQRLLDVVDKLERFPLRHALAPEAQMAGLEIRQMLFGSYRILYLVEAETVNILTVRHGARRFLEPGELTRD
jgi:plasmid stabilization system protein ParE